MSHGIWTEKQRKARGRAIRQAWKKKKEWLNSKYSQPVKLVEPVTDESIAIDILRNASKGLTRYQKYSFDNGAFFIIRSEYPVIEYFRKGIAVTITVLDEEDNRK